MTSSKGYAPARRKLLRSDELPRAGDEVTGAGARQEPRPAGRGTGSLPSPLVGPGSLPSPESDSQLAAASTLPASSSSLLR